MRLIEIARTMEQAGQKREAYLSYRLAIQEGDVEPEEEMEAALYILQAGIDPNDYKISYTSFYKLHQAGHFQEDILQLLTDLFYTPNIKMLKSRYERNCSVLATYPYLFRKDFPAFEDLPVRFFPYDDRSFLPYDAAAGSFRAHVDPKRPVISRNFFRDLDKPVLASDVFSQYELEYLYDNVRHSEYVAKENHIYLHYSSWAEFCSWLQILNFRHITKGKKIVFLMEEELDQYPIDFKERFGIDYSICPIRPLGIREVNRMIWHTQLATHNGGDLFNEVFDAHPNLLCAPSLMYDSVLSEIEKMRKQMEDIDAGKLMLTGAQNRVITELTLLNDRSDKDFLVAMFLSQPEYSEFLDPAARIAPALFFQPHFHNINYELNIAPNGDTELYSAQTESILKAPVFRGFKYIKTFTPLRRVTTSHAATVRFMWHSAQEASKKEGNDRHVVVNDAVLGRVLNRSFMIDWQDRLYADSILVRFEDAKLNPTATFTALAAFVDLPYTESMTYCSERGGAYYSDGTKIMGFDPVTVYRTYDEFANDAERCFIEYFMRDVYAQYGYEFHYYDGQPVDEAKLDELLAKFEAVDEYIRKSYALNVYHDAHVSINGQQVEKEVEDEVIRQASENIVAQVRASRAENAKILLRSGLHFVNRNGQPLHFMKKLELDPALMENPIYH